MRPVYGFNKDSEFCQLGLEDDPQFARDKFYWSGYGECSKGGHIVLFGSILKQVHCPVCEPAWDFKNDWRDVWDQPSESCPASHKR